MKGIERRTYTKDPANAYTLVGIHIYIRLTNCFIPRKHVNTARQVSWLVTFLPSFPSRGAGAVDNDRQKPFRYLQLRDSL